MLRKTAFYHLFFIFVIRRTKDFSSKLLYRSVIYSWPYFMKKRTLLRPGKGLIVSLFFLLLLFSSKNLRAQIYFEDAFEELFVEVQMKSVFKDSKNFPDCIPLHSPSFKLK